MNECKFTESSLINETEKQLISFWISLESIRWRFTSAFGIGAALALLLSKSGSVNQEIQIYSSIFIIFISLASLIAQVRIYGLINSVWYKIVVLQKLQYELMNNKGKISDITKSKKVNLHFPPPSKKSGGYFTVHIATCSIFIFLLNSGLYMILKTLEINDLYIYLISISNFILVIMLVKYLSEKYQDILIKKMG